MTREEFAAKVQALELEAGVQGSWTAELVLLRCVREAVRQGGVGLVRLALEVDSEWKMIRAMTSTPPADAKGGES